MREGWRAGLWLALAAAWLAAAPGRAAAALPVALYPVRGEGLTISEVADVQGLVASALYGAGHRESLRPREPIVLPKTCGAVPADACLAGLAKGGVVLVARAKKLPETVLLVLSMVDARGRRTKAVGLGVNLVVQDPRPIDRAIAALEFELEKLGGAAPEVAASLAPEAPAPSPRPSPPAGEREGTSSTSTATSTSTPTATATSTPTPTSTATPTPTPTPTPIPAPAPALAIAPPSPPTPAIVPESPFRPAPPDPERAWLRPTGQAWVAGGGVLLAGGAVVGFLGKRLSDDLDRRYQQGRLTPADHGSFTRARGLGIAANILLATGGAAALAGGTMWLLAPDVQPVPGGVAVGLQGRF